MRYKVWIEVEEYNPVTEEYESCAEPLDIECASFSEAIKLQTTMHQIGEAVQCHYGVEPDTADEPASSSASP